MGFFDDTLDFELFHGKEIAKDIWTHPRRLITGVDPFSTKMWNGILGTDDEPIVDQMGGATSQRYEDAEAEGINPKSGRKMQDLAHVVTALFAGNYGGEQAGLWGGSGSGAGASGNTLNYNPGGWDAGVFGGGEGTAGGGSGAGGASASGVPWQKMVGAAMNGMGQGMGGQQQPEQHMPIDFSQPAYVMSPEYKLESYSIAPDQKKQGGLFGVTYV